MKTQNFLVEFKHHNYQKADWLQELIDSMLKGKKLTCRGKSYCIIKNLEGEILGEGESVCGVSEKSFNRSIGRWWAVQRAMKDLTEWQQAEIIDGLNKLPSHKRNIIVE